MSNGIVGSPAFAAFDQGLSHFTSEYLAVWILIRIKMFLRYSCSEGAKENLLLFIGYDVFLGNFRGLVSREHINKNISSRQ